MSITIASTPHLTKAFILSKVSLETPTAAATLSLPNWSLQLGYNYGAKNFERVNRVIKTSLSSGFVIASLIGLILMSCSEIIPHIFTQDEKLIEFGPNAIFWIFSATPIVVFHLIPPSFYQAIGKPIPALLLTLLKQGVFLIPLVLILPYFYGINGVWYSFPISDILSAGICYYFLRKSAFKLNR